MLYLVDSAGARITDQLEMFPGRRGAGRIFYNQVQMSGQVPQVCLLFGPSAAGGAYIPAFCDVVAMVDGNASMYLGSPRMAEMVIGEKVTLEEMGGARMHCSVERLRRRPMQDRRRGDRVRKRYLAYMPRHAEVAPPIEAGRPAEEERQADRGHRPRRREQALRHDGRHRRDGRRGLVARDQGALRPGDPHRLRAHRRPGRRHRRESAQVARRASSSSTAPTRPRASSGCATRSASRSFTSPTCPAS